mgnify:CR=1 FL=1
MTEGNNYIRKAQYENIQLSIHMDAKGHVLDLDLQHIDQPEPARPAITALIDHTLLKPEATEEQIRTLFLDTKHRVIGGSMVYKGNVNTAVVRVGELFRDAVRANCVAIIVAHNHPSGDPTPSEDDVRITEDIVKAGKLLQIEVLDHLVIGQQGFVSLKERGLGFST